MKTKLPEAVGIEALKINPIRALCIGENAPTANVQDGWVIFVKGISATNSQTTHSGNSTWPVCEMYRRPLVTCQENKAKWSNRLGRAVSQACAKVDDDTQSGIIYIVNEAFEKLSDHLPVRELYGTSEASRILSEGYTSVSKSERKLIKAINEVLLESAETKRGAELKLLDNGLHQTTEAGLVLMQRFAKKRDEFLKKNKVVSGSEFAKLLGISDTNVARALGRKRAKGQVLSATLGDAEVYPLLQLNEQAQVYPALVSRLPDMYKYTHGWDIVFWLMETRTVQTKLRLYEKADLSKYGHDDAFNLDALLDDLDGDQSDSDVVTAAPLSLLQSGQDDLFSLFVDEWLNVSDMALPIEPAGQ